ncbi:MAG: HlyD family efflux transporter periplasmic adaptor subunit, partial [Chlorobiales bacterium]|nr:HlyD family efflux transporter periplasmic adaptor subunit [Chlorobiales bacterium]
MITVVFFLWASIARMEEVTHARGVVIAKTRNQVIQSAIDGIIQKVIVEEGQSVRKGQVLAHMERTQAEAAQKDSFGKVAALEAALARLRAEVLGIPLKFPPALDDYPEFVTNQEQLYLRRKEALENDLQTLRELLVLAKKELAMTRPLLESGDVGRIEVLRLERQVVEIAGQLQKRQNQFFEDAQKEMTKTEEDLRAQQQVLAERSFTVEKLDIRSPVDGMVKKINLTTQGARVRPGEVVMEILPTTSRLIVEGKLRPADIGFVHVGMPASVKLDAYDYSIYGMLKGSVVYISPDAITEMAPQGELLYYRVQIRLDEDEALLRRGKEIDIL